MFHQAKLAIVETLGLAKDALHVHVGLLILLAAAVLLRRRVGDALPLAVVIVAALTGEFWDILDRHAIGVAPDWPGHWKDVWNTCLWPAALTLLARTTALFARSGDGGEQPLE